MKKLWHAVLNAGDYVSLVGFWGGVWVYRLTVITLIGGIVGLLLSPILKPFFFEEIGWAAMLFGSFRIGCQYVGMWSLAIAFIWVVMDRKAILARAQRFFTFPSTPA